MLLMRKWPVQQRPVMVLTLVTHGGLLCVPVSPGMMSSYRSNGRVSWFDDTRFVNRCWTKT